MIKLNEDLSLKYLEHTPELATTDSAPIVLFLHGRGASETDLFDLTPKINRKFRVICPRAPIVMGRSAFAWFRTEYLPNGPVHDAAEAESARAILLQFIEEVKIKYNQSAAETFLFGFSQGGILSLSIALHFPEKIGGVAALSCRILPEFRPKKPFPEKLENFPILLSHGTTDNVLDIHYAREARQLISETPALLEYSEYPIGHDVTEMNFTPVVQWLDERIQHRE